MTEIFKDIPEIFRTVEPSFLERNWIWIAAVVFCFAALSAVLMLRKKSQNPPTPAEIADMRLNAAKSIAESKAYASAISSIVRDYISGVFKMPAPERTTQEFLQIAKSSEELSHEARMRIEEILTLSDMAKFARMDFDAHGRGQMFMLAQSFIHEDDARRREALKK